MEVNNMTTNASSNGHAPQVRLERIGPGRARELLASNKRNRPLKVTAVARYADLMRRGQWVLSNDVIVLDPDQFNGQNRLEAVIASETEQDFYVVDSMPAGSTEGFDQGVRRSLADHLTMRGATDGRALGATLWAIKILRTMWAGSTATFEGGNWDHRPTMADVIALGDQEFVLDSVAVGNRFKGSPLRIAPSLIAAIHHELSAIDPEGAARFVDRLLDGANMEPGDPIYRLRQSLLQEATTTPRGTRRDRTHVAARIIKAWNMWRRGRRDVQIVSWKRNVEEFPPILERMTKEQLSTYLKAERGYEYRVTAMAKAREAKLAGAREGDSE